MKSNFLMALLVFFVSATACKKPAGDQADRANYLNKDPQAGDGFMLYTEKTLFDRLAAGDDDGKPFKINKVSRAGDSLVVNVTYSSGCKAPVFSVVWDGRVAMSYPARISLVLKLEDASCTDSSGKITKDIRIDLVKYVGEFAADKHTVFSVKNASDKQVTELKPVSN